MSSSSLPGRKACLAGLLAAAFGFAAPAAAADPALMPAATHWSVRGDFTSPASGEPAYAQARTNLSGAACAPTRPPFAACLAVNDEKKYAQFYAITGTTLVPGAVIRLTGRDTRGDPDAEGAAYADGFFYVTGSHGRTRFGDQSGDSRFVVLRIPVDRRSGRPRFPVSQDEVVGVQASMRLREALREAAGIGPYYDKPLGENGVNIEGIAVAGGRLYLGFRGPSVDGEAFILSVDAAALFTPDRPLDATVSRFPLGATTGIRDLAAVRDGLLLLTGPVNDQPVTPALYLWSPRSGAVRRLGALTAPRDLPEHAKAETLLVLRDRPGRAWRLLILYDGAENGAPTEYDVPH